MTSVEVAEIRRPLSAYEHGFATIHDISPLNVVAWVRVRGEVRAEWLARAAAWVVAAHPLLRVRVGPGQRGRREFEPVAGARLPIRTVSAAPQDDAAAFREIDEVELCTPIDQRHAPLVRMVDIVHAAGTTQEAHDLILTGAHVIVDATALLALLRQIITAAAEFDELPVDAGHPAPYDLIPARARGLGRTAAVMLGDQLIGAVRRPRRVTVDDWVPIPQRRTRLLSRTIAGERVEALLHACRREQTTVHGALAAALAGAVGADLVPGGTGRVTIGSAVDLRADLIPVVGPDELGSYVTDLPGHIAFGPAVNFWDTARMASRNIVRRKDFGQHLTTLTAARLLFPQRWANTNRRVITFLDRQGPFGVGLSNLGRIDFPDRVGAWELSDAQFTASTPTGRISCSVTTGASALHWNFSYVAGLVATPRAERIAGDAVAAVLAAIDT
ncbi:hypothetical protein GFY24_01460 [Nocardia sp. SYP-A9097]|uniref:phthiocerol/phthiodiolone dimycocerosyl transferase family protein n=1 Tax=Nocardia sp. SYP-A9097 TaxID=2663237 RepID=UPI00129AAA38|nr:hypothetical protein [Nocardia sp. SYP-A9097]MRH86142.1 hypothetical protein [Nocardia sp. SYP-A9097]